MCFSPVTQFFILAGETWNTTQSSLQFYEPKSARLIRLSLWSFGRGLNHVPSDQANIKLPQLPCFHRRWILALLLPSSCPVPLNQQQAFGWSIQNVSQSTVRFPLHVGDNYFGEDCWPSGYYHHCKQGHRTGRL